VRLANGFLLRRKRATAEWRTKIRKRRRSDTLKKVRERHLRFSFTISKLLMDFMSKR
jgi:hypothetical protein